MYQKLFRKICFIPQRVDQTKFDSMKTHFKLAIFFELREDLSDKIYKMLENASPLLRKNQINEDQSQESLQQKQIYLTKLVEKSGVQINEFLQDAGKSEFTVAGTVPHEIWIVNHKKGFN